MEKEPHIIPRPAVKGIATGLCMMAFFTLMWAGIAFNGLQQTNWWFLLLIFPCLSVLFIFNMVKLFKKRVSKQVIIT